MATKLPLGRGIATGARGTRAGATPSHGSSKSDRLFPATSWSVLSMAADSSAGAAATGQFLELYYLPIRRFIQSILRSSEEAEELTQKFLLQAVIEGNLIQKFKKDRGHFRDFLKQAIRNFLADDFKFRSRSKRGGGRPALEVDGLAGGWEAVAVAVRPTQDEAFMRGWAQSVVQVALTRLRTACTERGQVAHFELFVGRYLTDDDAPSWRDLGRPFALDEKTARSRADTIARQFRVTMHQLIAEMSGSTRSPGEEIAGLLALLDGETLHR